MQEVASSSSAYVPIKRLLEILTFIPPKDLETEGYDQDYANGFLQHRVSFVFEDRIYLWTPISIAVTKSSNIKKNYKKLKE